MNRLFSLCLLLCLPTMAQAPSTVLPLLHAHAHNDYEHARPLLDALDHGFCSVEADVWLMDGLLLVAHDRKDAKPDRTLERLYLDPLRERIAKNGGQVYRGGPSLTLLIDVKSDATNTYLTLSRVLRNYEKILTRFTADRTEINAITVIISGNRARDLMAAETARLAAYDGRLDDLDSSSSRHFIPLISDTWTRVFKWRGEGPFPDDEKQKLKSLVERTHQQGRRLRFWATRDTPALWRELLAAGVDLINTDDLEGFLTFSQGK